MGIKSLEVLCLGGISQRLGRISFRLCLLSLIVSSFWKLKGDKSRGLCGWILLSGLFLSTLLVDVSSSIQCIDVWKLKAPQRVISFSWLDILCCILTLDNLQKGGLHRRKSFAVVIVVYPEKRYDAALRCNSRHHNPLQREFVLNPKIFEKNIQKI